MNFKDKNEYRYNPDGDSKRDIYNKFFQMGVENLSSHEKRNLLVSSDVEGGYLAPEATANWFQKELDDYVHIRQHSKKVKLDRAYSFNIPKRGQKISAPLWTQELGTGDEDDSLSMEMLRFTPTPLAKRIRVSRTLMRMAKINPEDIVLDEFRREFGETLENQYMVGQGPGGIGIFVASDFGISNDRDIESGSAATIESDDIYRLVSHVRAPYYYEGLTYKEIGEYFGVSFVTINQTMRSIKSKFLNLFKENQNVHT